MYNAPGTTALGVGGTLAFTGVSNSLTVELGLGIALVLLGAGLLYFSFWRNRREARSVGM